MQERATKRAATAMPDIYSESGKEILAWATTQEYCVLEFEETEEGGTRVADITDHVKELERQVEG